MWRTKKSDADEDDRPQEGGERHPREIELAILRHATEEKDRRPIEGQGQHAAELPPDEREDEPYLEHTRC